MPTDTRVYDQMMTAEGGMDGGKSPMLIAPNQYAFGSNISVRGGYAKTRPPFSNLRILFDSDATEERFTGKFQGACAYDAATGGDSFIVSRGGKLFNLAITKSTATVSEITPTLSISTTQEFTVPALNDEVIVYVTSETVFEIGDALVIDSGAYEVVSKLANAIQVEYQGGAANATVAIGAPVTYASGGNVIEVRTNPSFFDFIYLFPAENYIIVNAKNQKPVIFDGSTTFFPATNGIPSGIVGSYGMGRIWQVLNDGKTFRGGDIVFGSSGTVQNSFRDAILLFTENNYIDGGGDLQARVFGSQYVAGDINAVQFLATQDTSLGLGPLQMFCSNMVFSVDAPVDRTEWANLNYPIRTISLLEDGCVGPRSIASFNSDIWYRSPRGVSSFIMARRNFGNTTAPANTPNSREVSTILDFDDANLLYYGSMISFKNRIYQTVSPVRTENGVVHKGLVSINFDLISDLRQKLVPAWEGLTTGLNIFQVAKGIFDGIERAFAFVDNDGELELWEFVEGYEDIYNTDEAIQYVPIQSVLETRSFMFGDQFQLKQLDNLSLYFDEVVGDEVSVTVKFRPDQYPNWIDWHTFEICGPVRKCDSEQPSSGACNIDMPGSPQYAVDLKLPSPPENCNTIAGTTVNRGFTFQIRLEWTGHLRLKQLRIGALMRGDKIQGDCGDGPACSRFESCATEWFTYDSHGE